jgi:uncharacterized membrane protein YhaH (DUF805 family)
MEWYLKVMRQYADFSGRARRKEYWMFILFNVIFAIIAMVLDNVLGLNFEEGSGGPIYIIYALIALIPGLAVAVRRLHDVGKSGWMFFIVLIPIIGSIWLLVLMCSEGESSSNAYGSNPKDASAELNEIGKTFDI